MLYHFRYAGDTIKQIFLGSSAFRVENFTRLFIEAFHMGIRCMIATLSKNRISKQNQHQKVLQQQIACMRPPQVGKKTYTPDILIRAFDYYSASRSLYQRLRDDYKLPSVKTLSTITSKVRKLTDATFIKDVFSSLKEEQKQCVVLVDEVYVKTIMEERFLER